MNKKERKLFMSRVKPMLTELRRMHRKFGADFLFAMRKYLDSERKETSRIKQMHKLQEELDELHRKRGYV